MMMMLMNIATYYAVRVDTSKVNDDDDDDGFYVVRVYMSKVNDDDDDDDGFTCSEWTYQR